jgi:hypothetical protein
MQYKYTKADLKGVDKVQSHYRKRRRLLATSGPESYICAGIGAVVLGITMFAAAPENNDPKGVQTIGVVFIILGIIMAIGGVIKVADKKRAPARFHDDPVMSDAQIDGFMKEYNALAGEELARLRETLRTTTDESRIQELQKQIKHLEEISFLK